MNNIWLKEKTTNNKIEEENIPEYMNKFFTEIGPKLALQHDSHWKYYGDTIENDIPDVRTDVDEVIALCKEIEITKSSGIDEISSRLCKDAFLALPHHLTHVFNCSLDKGFFPGDWKIAKVVPIYKGGDREDVGNFSPVSLLPLPGKILEKVVHKRISDFLEANGFLSGHQGGFRKGFSTTSTIADLTDDLFGNVNKGETTLAAFVDLKKAFDTVNTKILLRKLHEAGIRGKLLEWCKCY